MLLRARVAQRLVVGLVCLGAGGLLLAHRAVGQAQQSGAGPMQFEVVSIKPNLTGRVGNMGMIRDGYQAEDLSLLQWIVAAYGLRRDYQVLGLPEWARWAHYDVAAKVGGPDAVAFQKLYYPQMFRLFQPVLEDRFGLRFHWEKRVLPTYTLTLMKRVSALKDATAADDKMVHVDGSDASIGAGAMFTGIDGRVIGRAVPMRLLVEHLEGEMNSIVVDATGLKGTYDYELQLPRTRESGAAPTGEVGSPEPEDSVAGALYEIGLKLVPSKTEQPVLVVDGIQQPSAN